MAIQIPFFGGGAAARSAVAAGQIRTASDPSVLTAALTGLRLNLSGVGVSDPRLRMVAQALDSYIGDAQGGRDSRGAVADAVEALPDPLWVLGVAGRPVPQQAFLGPERRGQVLGYLHELLESLRRIVGSRIFLTGTSSDDQSFIRLVTGGLSAFLIDMETRPDAELIGMVETVTAQITDAAIQAIGLEEELTFPNPPVLAVLAAEVVASPPLEQVPHAAITRALAESPFREINPDRYTLYAQPYIAVVAAHRPIVSNKGNMFMMYVKTLERIYRAYWNQLRRAGSADFETAYQEAFGTSQYSKLPKIKNTYSQLFLELCEMLEAEPDLKGLVEAALESGEHALDKSKPRPFKVSGGPAASPSGDEGASTEPGRRRRPTTSTATPAVPAGPPAAELEAGLFPVAGEIAPRGGGATLDASGPDAAPAAEPPSPVAPLPPPPPPPAPVLSAELKERFQDLLTLIRLDLGGNEEPIEDLLVKLARIWGIHFTGVLEQLTATYRLPISTGMNRPRNLGEFFDAVLHGDARRGGAELAQIAAWHREGLLILNAARKVTISEPVRRVVVRDGVLVTLSPEGPQVPMTLPSIGGGRLLLRTRGHGIVDATPDQVAVINELALLSQAGFKASLWVEAAGVQPRFLRLVWHLHPEAEVFVKNEGVLKTLRRREATFLLEPQKGDLYLEGLTPDPSAIWRPEEHDLHEILTSRGVQEDQIWGPLQDIFPSDTGLRGPLTYEALVQPLGRLKQGLVAAIQSAPDADWVAAVEAIESEILAILDESPNEGEGVASLMRLPELVGQARDLLRGALEKELQGYKALLDPLKGRSDLPAVLQRSGEMTEILLTRLGHADQTLPAKFFESLSNLRIVLQGWTRKIEELLGSTPSSRFRYESEDDLDLPPVRADLEDLARFLTRYGFVRTGGRFHHPASSVAIEVPTDPLVDKTTARESRLAAIRAVAEALRKTGEMAPAPAEG